MDAIITQIKSLLADEAKMQTFLLLALILGIGSLIFGFIGRCAFGKKSVLNQSVSSAIGILFIYLATIVVYSFGVDLQTMMSPLPFVSIQDNCVYVYPVLNLDFPGICNELLSIVILAFVVNIVNRWMPQGENFFTWLLFRILSVALGMLAFTLVNMLLLHFVPEGLFSWAPTVLLCLLVLMLLLGVMKIFVGAALVTVNPILAVFYTFFFANVVGKMLSRAMLTSLLLGILVVAINYLGITVITIGLTALVACIPIMILLLVLWYIVGKLL